MTAFTKNFEKLAELQQVGLEPMRKLSVFAVDAFEKLARRNHAFAGDVLEFAVEQARLPSEVAEPKELIERQVASSKDFAELLTDRAGEYLELGKEWKDATAALFDVELAKPAPKSAKAAKQKAA